MYHARSKRRGCNDGCDVKTDVDPGFEDQEREFIERACRNCPHRSAASNRMLENLLRVMRMQDGRCPVGRAELLDIEWEWLGVVRQQWEHLEVAWQKERTHDDAPD